MDTSFNHSRKTDVIKPTVDFCCFQAIEIQASTTTFLNLLRCVDVDVHGRHFCLWETVEGSVIHLVKILILYKAERTKASIGVFWLNHATKLCCIKLHIVTSRIIRLMKLHNHKVETLGIQSIVAFLTKRRTLSNFQNSVHHPFSEKSNSFKCQKFLNNKSQQGCFYGVLQGLGVLTWQFLQL